MKNNENYEKYKTLLKALYADPLKAAGFRRYGPNFRRFSRSQIFLTGFVVSFAAKTAPDGSVSFTVYLGRKSSFNDEPTTSFLASDCMIADRTDLPEIASLPFGKRWIIDGKTDIKALEEELKSLIVTYAFPWFRIG